MSQEDSSRLDTEKRLLLALVLSTVVLLFSPYLIQWFYPGATTPESAPPPERTQPVEDLVEESVPEEPLVGASEALVVEETAGVERVLEITNRDMVVRVSSRGLRFESVKLLNYVNAEKQPLELVPENQGTRKLGPFSVVLGDEDMTQAAAAAIFEVEGAVSDQIKAPASLRFRYRGGNLAIERRLTIPESGFGLEMETRVEFGGRSLPLSLFLGPGIGRRAGSRGIDPADTTGDFAFPLIAYLGESGIDRVALDDLEATQVLEAPVRWVAYDSRFFAYLLLGPGALNRVRLKQETWEGEAGEGESPLLTVTAEVGVVPGSGVTAFFGPKALETLQRLDPSLGDLVDFGWFAVLVRPLLFCLKLAYSFVHNYGWAIIIVTFFINLVLLPIRYKQMSSMKKMSALQPKLKAIQDRYKKLPKADPKRQDMNREIMALYQEHGVNPLGGCLPLLVQMPFLFAFYQMLASSIELRGAPFIWWIQDLSKADPYYITPIVMGITMLAQQKMTPAAGDPAQRRMMMLMPLVFMFFFLSLSSGLVIYFLFSNVFGMAFQWAIQKMGEQAPAPAKPRKKRGKG